MERWSWEHPGGRVCKQAYVPLVSSGEFAYRSKEIPVIVFLASMLDVYTLQTEIFHLLPKIDQRGIVIAGGEVRVSIQKHVA